MFSTCFLMNTSRVKADVYNSCSLTLFFFFSVNSWNAKFCSTADGSGGQQASLSSWLPCNITFRRGEPHISIRNLIPGNKEDNGVRRKEADGGFSTCYWRKRWETEDEGTRRPIRENRVQVCQVKGALQLLWNSACSSSVQHASVGQIIQYPACGTP